jgi:antirestriction protein ArdC
MKHSFGSPEYAKEELIAELSAAVIASQHGLSKHIKNDSATYLKSWLGSLKESPEFLKTVLGDVKRSTGMINQRLVAIEQEMEKGEKADYSQFRPVHGTGRAPAVEGQAAKEAQEEEKPSYHWSR